MSSEKENKLTITGMLPGYVDYLAVERQFSPATVKAYHYNIQRFARDIGNLPVADINLQHIIALKARMTERGAHESRIGGAIAAVKSLLEYARDVLRVPVVDPKEIRAPRLPRREVVYLNNEELERFMAAIGLKTWSERPRMPGYRFRALCETLAATGMRISEALALNRDSIDFDRRQALILGKGNKQRTVFFSERALHWITRYLDFRADNGEALFATEDGSRLKRSTVQVMFLRITKRAGLEKRVTAHVLRHTVATNLLMNGCPIGYIKEILGHSNLQTTCRYYLGILHKEDTQKAHRAYLDYSSGEKGSADQEMPSRNAKQLEPQWGPRVV